jgi:hypothetical protein
LTYRSLLMAVPLVFPLPPLEVSVHISLTSSSSLLRRRKQCGEKKKKEYEFKSLTQKQHVDLDALLIMRCYSQVHMAIVGLDASQQFMIVSDIDQNLGVSSDGLVQDGIRS